MEITKNNYIYHISQKKNELHKMYVNRTWCYIDSLNNHNINTLKDNHKLSNLWSNIKYLECTYDQTTINNIKKKINKEMYDFN